MLKTLNEEIDPHHRGFAVAARDDNDVQTIGLHTCEQTNARYAICLLSLYGGHVVCASTGRS